MEHQIFAWIAFTLFVLAMLVLDLYVFHRSYHVVDYKEALIWSVVWVGLALLFNVGIYFLEGFEPALAFLSGYLIEKALSVDNLFVFLLIIFLFSGNLLLIYSRKRIALQLKN